MQIKLADSLFDHTGDVLKKLASVINPGHRLVRKSDLVDLITEHLLNKSKLREIFDSLSEIDKLAVGEATHSASGNVDLESFKAKYGSAPSSLHARSYYSRKDTASVINLLFAGDKIPIELKTLLRTFVPKPKESQLETLEVLPETFGLKTVKYVPQEDDEGSLLITKRASYFVPRKEPVRTTVITQIPMKTRDTSCGALKDVLTMLRLIDAGKISVSDKTKRPSQATMGEIACLLKDGEFYQVKQTKNACFDQEIGHISAFAWPLLLQAAGLAELRGKRLVLTKNGLDALNLPPAETIKKVWKYWLKTTLLDEFQRVDAIKGQTGRGAKSMTSPANRREVIVDALQKCPAGRWVNLDEFSRYMQASRLHFSVTSDPWHLYICDSNYGSLGYNGSNGWNVLQARYIFCFLFEYAATLGLIDVAYAEPDEVRFDYGDLWGSDSVNFLSRYDGLLYFRLNTLGKYCLGSSDDFQSPTVQQAATLTVLPSMQITLLEEAITPEVSLLLDSYAEREANTVWRLARHKAIATVERGHHIAELRDFLQSRDEQPLPETVETFINTTEKQARALKNQGNAILIECSDPEIAELIAKHKNSKHLCQKVGKQSLVVRASDENQFRKIVNIIGYGMPET